MTILTGNGDKLSLLERVLRGSLVAMAFGLPFYIAVSQNLVILAALLWIAVQVKRRRVELPRTPLEIGFAAYLVAELISLPFSTNLPQSVLYLRRFLLIGVVYLVGGAVPDLRWLRRMVVAFLAGAAVYSLWGLVFFLQHPDMRVRHIHNSVTTGGITFLAAGFAFALLLGPQARRMRLMAGVTGALAALCLFLTNTRGSWLAFFVTAVFLLAVRRPRLLWTVPLAVLLAYVAVPQTQKVRVRGFFDPNWESNRNRLVWWRTGLAIFADHPLVGIGDVGTEEMYRKYRRDPQEIPAGHMHNNFLHIAVTLGLVGLMGFLFMLWRLFTFLWRAYRRAADATVSSLCLGIFALFLGFQINGLFEWNFGDQEVVTILWFMVGLSVAAWRLEQLARREEGSIELLP
ncbi:MAG: O-antigen ligase family protein [candidate division KSB1 bacterium]|nr:O-antigen ligase family protein [candidate division KSB1 bacterium]